MQTLRSKELREWLKGVKPEEFPPAPFELFPGGTVLNSAKWLASLIADLDNIARNKSGDVDHDIERAHTIWSSENIKRLESMQF